MRGDGYSPRQRIAAADVRAALAPADLAEYFGLRLTEAVTGAYVSDDCPGCGPRRRPGSARQRHRPGLFIWRCDDGWRWSCARCWLGGGDLLGLVGELAQLDRARDFPRIVELAAELAGVAAPAPASDRGRRAAGVAAAGAWGAR